MKIRTGIAVCLVLFSAMQVQADEPLPPAVAHIASQGITIIKKIKGPGGMQGWLGQYQGMGVTIYLTPDGKHAISGYLYDEKGNNLSEALFKQELYIPQGRALWKKMIQGPVIKSGRDDAPRKLVVFADPFCPYCMHFHAAAQPWVDAGKVQLYTRLVAVLKPQSGRYAAAILSASDPAKAWDAWEQSGGKKSPAPGEKTPQSVVQALQVNQQLMDEAGANATPAIYYLNQNNELQQVVGMPDEQQMAAMFGPK
ncbi:thiol:disulfide interchange protein DsbG [Mangrovibacter phragmitis]|uniref:Thiol:disulfide interchange protein n=1 Tax=Mangrovibacter phragmitis TaxID=1691903 RepID=A0A1B7L4A1_9ENTR|nr:thiol:disulfide interchange protein DsbG [Mangrovibacter phragmitis]OAT76981.1 thiol:disulfide interchange protein DsbG [Mangrovibacter phragmitis]